MEKLLDKDRWDLEATAAYKVDVALTDYWI
jgi:hypothetical protein